MNVFAFDALNVFLLACLVVTAIAIARLRGLFAVAMLSGIYSLLSASVFVLLDAVDVAFTEAAVGAGMTTVLFLGGWLPPFDWAPLYYVPGIVWLLLKTFFFFFMFSWVMATVPRYRYDQLMRLGWKVFLPISLGFVVVISGYLMATGHFG